MILKLTHPKHRTWLERLVMSVREPWPEQLMEVLRDAGERDILSADVLHMIESVPSSQEAHVRDVMIPKAQMTVIESDNQLEAIRLVIESGHSRFPSPLTIIMMSLAYYSQKI